MQTVPITQSMLFVVLGFMPLIFGMFSILERTTFIYMRRRIHTLTGSRAVTVGGLYVLLGLPLVLAGVKSVQGIDLLNLGASPPMVVLIWCAVLFLVNWFAKQLHIFND